MRKQVQCAPVAERIRGFAAEVVTVRCTLKAGHLNPVLHLVEYIDVYPMGNLRPAL
jgi:hypothetical protein